MKIRRGEVWKVRLNPTEGSEINKERPCVVVSNDAIGALPLKIIVPITEWKDRYAMAPWLIPLEVTAANGLSKKSAADTFQVRSISEERFIEKLGELKTQDLQLIEAGLAICLDIVGM
jgi:mRNA interferase MazF